MPDIVDKATRSRMMSGIRGKDTAPELVIRRGLHAHGLRFRLHAKDLPGRPDLVLPRFRAAILVHGCFWHHHDCHLFKMPSTRRDFWEAKINGNVRRDLETRSRMTVEGWRSLVVWECALKGRTRLDPAVVLDRIRDWLERGASDTEIGGDDGRA